MRAAVSGRSIPTVETRFMITNAITVVYELCPRSSNVRRFIKRIAPRDLRFGVFNFFDAWALVFNLFVHLHQCRRFLSRMRVNKSTFAWN
jgi:hypothetical protein